MNVLTIVSPGLKVLFERVGKPEGYQSPGGASAQRGGCSYRLQSHRLGGQPLGSICRLSEAASLYVEAGAVQFACRQMDLGAGRIICQSTARVPSRDSIKTALDLLKNGEILLIFPSGTRNDQSSFV